MTYYIFSPRVKVLLEKLIMLKLVFVYSCYEPNVCIVQVSRLSQFSIYWS